MGKKLLIILIAALIFIFIVIVLTGRQKSQPEVINNNNQPKMESTDIEDIGRYVDYSKLNIIPGKTNIIFFAAKWCPSCNQLDKNLQAQRNVIPSNINILKADYDNETELKKKYGITIQHTLVQVDENGELIKKWNGLYDQYELQDIIDSLE